MWIYGSIASLLYSRNVDLLYVRHVLVTRQPTVESHVSTRRAILGETRLLGRGTLLREMRDESRLQCPLRRMRLPLLRRP